MRRGLRTALLTLTCAGCSFTTTPFTTPAPEAVSELEARWEQDRTDLPTALLLAAVHADAGRLEEAYGVLEETEARLPSGDPTLELVLGMTAQELGRAVTADAWLEAFEARGPFGPLADDVALRREALHPRVLLERAEARSDGFEGSGSWPAAESSTVAFLPLSASSDDDVALATALADLAAQDFATLSPDVTEPARVRALLRALGEDSGPFTLGTAGRVGGILGVGAVVYGELDRPSPDRLRMRGTVLRMLRGVVTVGTFELEAAARDARALATRLAVRGRRLTSGPVGAEEVATVGLGSAPDDVALTSFGRGLRLSVGGEHAAAAQAYQEAAAAAPTFEVTTAAAERASAAAVAEATPLTAATVAAARSGELARAVAAVRSQPSSAHQAALGTVGDQGRSVATELFGRDRLIAGTLYDLVFTFPGTGP